MIGFAYGESVELCHDTSGCGGVRENKGVVSRHGSRRGGFSYISVRLRNDRSETRPYTPDAPGFLEPFLLTWNYPIATLAAIAL